MVITAKTLSLFEEACAQQWDLGWGDDGDDDEHSITGNTFPYLQVVPMSRQSGVLEWCEGTQPIGSYLVGNNGAHARYRPNVTDCVLIHLRDSFIAIFFTRPEYKFWKLILHTLTFDNICVTYYKLLSLLQDISFTAARSKFISIQAGRRTLAEKLNIYLGILKNFKPVFHHFFTEHYLDPVTWYERRLAYTKR